MNTYTRLIAIGLYAGLFGAPALAATFSGTSQDITDFANGSEVSTRGTLIDAINIMNDDQAVPDTVINGVQFKGVAPGQFHEAGEPFSEASFVYHGGQSYADDSLWSSGGAYDVLADSQIFEIDSPAVNYGDGFGVVNLAPGTLYELQIFMLDDRDGIDKNFPLQFQQVIFTGSSDQFVPQDPAPPELGYFEGITIGGAGVTQANGEIATIVFSIDEGINGIFVNSWNGGAFNGMQLRSLGVHGDYNGNGSVGPEDYDTWKANFGSTENLAADGNADGIVNAADYTIWRDRTSGGAGSLSLGGAAIPEPSTSLIALAAVALVGNMFARSSRRHPE
jgi:hypothetical protein